MKIEIENYRGWAISFDTEQETFYCHSEQWDIEESKKSFASVKRWIDEFIKDNHEFKPVWFERRPNSYSSHECIKIIGIRKDGKFVYEEEGGGKKAIPSYNERDYILSTPKNDELKEALKVIDSELENLRIRKNP
jgi:hypothetical protein